MIFLLHFGCNDQNEVEKDNFKLRPTNEFLEFHLHNAMTSIFSLFVGHNSSNNEEILYYFSKLDSTLRVISIPNKNQTFYNLKNILKNRISYSPNEVTGFYMENSSNLWIDSPISDSIYQINLSELDISQVVEKTLTTSKYNINGLRAGISTLINSNKQEIVTGIYNSEDSLKSHKTALFGILKIKTSQLKLKKFIGFPPKSYWGKDMYLNSGMVTAISNDTIIISYHYSDSVDFYVNGELKERVCMGSDYSSENFNAFEGDIYDINAIRKRFIMDARYNQLIYDKKKSLYYRVFIHQKKSTGKIEESKKWSLCIFNSKFKKIHEEVFNIDNYGNLKIYSTNSGLFIENTKKTSYTGDPSESSFISLQKFILTDVKN